MQNVLNQLMACPQVRPACVSDGAATAMILLLEQLAGVICDLSDDQYVTKPVGVVPSSIGAHVRHCLDHVESLLTVRSDNLLDYDQRERGTDVERNRHAALAAIDALSRRLSNVSNDDLGRLLRVRLRMAVDNNPILATSSFGRELAYVLSHTIHHNAIVGGMVKTLGVTLPEAFGYAPSTLLASRTTKVCA
jgi:uncharacterized damage-inducible protein DinB